MPAIDVVRQHSKAKRREVVVEEWGGMKLYFTPITVSDMKAVDARKPEGRHDRNLVLIIEKAQDEDGNPLFSYGDRVVLEREAEYTVLQDIIFQMLETEYGGDVEKAQEAIKNDPISGSDSTSPSTSEKPSKS